MRVSADWRVSLACINSRDCTVGQSDKGLLSVKDAEIMQPPPGPGARAIPPPATARAANSLGGDFPPRQWL